MFTWNLRDRDTAAEEADNLIALHRAVLENSGSHIDEVALVVRQASGTQRVLSALDDAGWREFNKASDRVETYPFGLGYTVNYLFLRHADFPWRIELMHAPGIPGGHSPLHMALLTQFDMLPEYDKQGRVPVAHISYKVPTIEALEDEQEWLARAGYLHGMRCKSTYGEFSYWRMQPDRPYLKPRVNLRDGAA